MAEPSTPGSGADPTVQAAGHGYVIAPGRLAAVCVAVYVGLGVVAVSLRPDDWVAQVACAAGAVMSGLTAWFLLRGWLEPRRVGAPATSNWPRMAVVFVAVYVTFALAEGHGRMTGVVAGNDIVLAGVLVQGSLEDRRKRRNAAGNVA